MSTLVKKAGLDIALVEEVAADIFMGVFTAKWSQAAELACRLLGDGFYGRYYQLPEPREVGKDRFSRLCKERSKEAGIRGGGGIARQGAIIEQSQILTTHNLAALTFGLNLESALREQASQLARAGFDFVLRRQARCDAKNYRARLIMTKNTAYAWRQALFFMTLCPASEQARIIGHCEARFQGQDRAFRRRFGPAVRGLRHIQAGGCFDASGQGPDCRRFLGWSVGPHWSLA